MLKNIFKFIFLIIVMNNFIFGGANQIWLPNGLWTPIGIKGIYKLDQNAESWKVDFTTILEDVADDKTTYAKGDTTRSNNFYVDVMNNTTKKYSEDTSILHATIGIFAIKGGTSKKLSNYVVLDGTRENIVKIKIPQIKNKDYDLPMYRMYIEGREGVPAIRIDYQGDYEGDKFRVKFADEKEDYICYFNNNKTFNNPSKIYTPPTLNITSSSPIERAVDFNISDNSLVLLSENSFKILNDDGITVGGSGVSKFNPERMDDLTIYRTNGNNWDIFNSKNTRNGSNDFSILEPGKGYWVLAKSQLANNDGNKTKIGIITKDESEITFDSYKNITNGWNMLSFPDSDLRYATSGMFIPLGTIAESGVNVFFNHLGDNNANNGSDRVNYIKLSGESSSDINYSNPADIAQYINLDVKNKQTLYGEETNLRAFPAYNPHTTPEQSGVVLIASHLFEVNSSNSSIITLSGASLMATNRNTYSTTYGEYILSVDMNEINGTEINGSMEIMMPGEKFNSAGAKVFDLNNNEFNLSTSAQKIKRALVVASTPSNSRASSALSNTILIDLNFVTEHNPYNKQSNFRSILMSAQTRFSIRDITYIKAFRQENNGTFYIVGDKSIQSVSGRGLSLGDSINNKTSESSISYSSLGGSYFVISSPSARSLDLLEANGVSPSSKLFDDIALNDGTIPINKRHLTRGAITFVRDHKNIMSVKVRSNLKILEGNKTALPNTKLADFNVSRNNYGSFDIIGDFPFVTSDLKPNAIWSTDFPLQDGPINLLAQHGKQISSIMTMNKSTNNDHYWAFTDLTKTPDTWYDKTNKDTQDIFHIFSQKAYWVKIKTRLDISPGNSLANNEKNPFVDYVNSNYTYSVYSHFNNDILASVGKTTNHLDHTLTISFNKSFIDPNKYGYYDVLTVIAGEEHRLRHNGRDFQLRISSNELNIRERAPGGSTYPILIKAYNGFGINFSETPKNHKYDIDFVKPRTPILKWDNNGELKVNVESGTGYEIYQDYISDIEIDRLKNKISNIILSSSKKLQWKIAGSSSEGVIKTLKVIAKKPLPNQNYLYSDIKAIPYAPLQSGHVLAIEKNSTTNMSMIPYSFIQNQFLTYKDIGDKITPKYSGKNGIDNGVELKRLKQAIDTQKSIRMAYYPIGAKEGDKRLNAFGGNHTMYLKIGKDSPKPIGYITYVKAYANKPFYIYYNDSLYKGIFANDNENNNDASSYDLFSGYITVDSDHSGAQGNFIDYGKSSINSQPIIIPSTPKGGSKKPKVPKDNNASSNKQKPALPQKGPP